MKNSSDNIYLMAQGALRDWSLITGRGGYKTEGGHVKFYPYERRGGGGGKSFSHAEGGAQQVLG